MKFLLDTHAFLWAYSNTKRIPAKARAVIADPNSEIFVSAVSFWEIALKTALGKLESVGEHPSNIVAFAESLGFIPISITPEEGATYGNLTESTHYDPFDRMLIWQAISRKLTLVSGDKEFRRFEKDGLKLIWK